MPENAAHADVPLYSVGSLIRDARRHHGWTQARLADSVGVTHGQIVAVEGGDQPATPALLARVGAALDAEVVPIGQSGPLHLRVAGGTKLSGSISVKTSKNSGVGLLCASLLNKGRTVLRRVARIEEVNRICEVLTSIGVQIRWLNDQNDLEIIRPARLDLSGMDADAARRTRSVLMFLGPLMHDEEQFELPYAGGCDLGTRTIEPHLIALRPFGLQVKATSGYYRVDVAGGTRPQRAIVLTERGDTVTENAIMAAARQDGVTTIRNASSNYAIQDLCFFLSDMGVRIEGIGSTTLVVHGLPDIDCEVDYALSEDPIEAFSLLTAAVVTGSQITIERAPLEFLEVELAVLEEMGLKYGRSEEYVSGNGRTRLVDLEVFPSTLHAPIDKIHAMPFPGINIDNLPFFALIAATAQGSSLIHDWVYENRAIYLTELNRLGARITLLDPHRIWVEGPTHWSGTEMVCPPALRPAVVILLAMLAAKGTSVLRNVYIINRGYEALAERLNELGAQIEVFRDV